MRILDRYIGKQVLSSTLIGVVVLSGVLVLGQVFKELDRILGDADVPLIVVLKFLVWVLPFSLIFTIPWGFLTAILLSYGRMSADNEMISMRMAGLSMRRICMPVFVLAAVLTAFCLWVNVSLAPAAKAKIKGMFFDVVLEDPTSLFQPRRTLDQLPGYLIYTEEREGANLKDLQIVRLNGKKPEQYIAAKTGEVVFDKAEEELTLNLKEVYISVRDPQDLNNLAKTESLHLAKTSLNLSLKELKAKGKRVTPSMKKTSVLRGELSSGVDSMTGEELNEERRTGAKTEINKRYSFSLACLTFSLVGIPLGITAQRRETSIGFAVSLIIACIYFMFIILAEGVREDADKYPHILMWLPNVVFLSIGGWLFWKLSRR